VLVLTSDDVYMLQHPKVSLPPPQIYKLGWVKRIINFIKLVIDFEEIPGIE